MNAPCVGYSDPADCPFRDILHGIFLVGTFRRCYSQVEIVERVLFFPGGRLFVYRLFLLSWHGWLSPFWFGSTYLRREPLPWRKRCIDVNVLATPLLLQGFRPWPFNRFFPFPYMSLPSLDTGVRTLCTRRPLTSQISA